MENRIVKACARLLWQSRFFDDHGNSSDLWEGSLDQRVMLRQLFKVEAMTIDEREVINSH
ncbi:MAG: hypothetical protein IJU76_03355 [Desulfovibrionaceae bacterium]|nr:hypothetical protein [Desulfovibrionaceae bacterium]